MVIVKKKGDLYKVEANKGQQPGTAFGSGRPATGRTNPITIRVSDEALEILQSVKNKSKYIDNLIRLQQTQNSYEELSSEQGQ